MRVKWTPLLYQLLIAALLVGVWGGSTLYADNTAKNPIEWLGVLEKEITGETIDGSMLERLDHLEELISGRVREGSLVQRLTYIQNVLYTNQPHDISFLYKVQALEWVVFKRCLTGSIRERLENLEFVLFNKIFAGPINKRLEKLVEQVFPNGIIKGRWVTVPEGTLVKVVINDEISSTKNQEGDTFSFNVVDPVTVDGMIIFPKGVTGKGVLQRIKPPSKMGVDARIILDFQSIRTLDGTPASLVYGALALEMNRSRKLAVGASAAGMIFLGPEGILFGLVVKGKEKIIPRGTEFYLQLQAPLRIYTISES